jgi:RNA polymerase sigma-70 factor (ECF subfamily)
MGDAVATMELLARARAGDGEAFGQLVEPYRRELQVHCYRMLGSLVDAEDALQDTLLSAWQGLARFEGRASVRTWLYRVATSRCLDSLRSVARRRPTSMPAADGDAPAPTRTGEVLWLEPYPDVLLDTLADSAPGPEARYEARESISLAFVKALHLLPPRQRATMILREVLGFHASEAAAILGTTEESVTSALKRARATLHRRYPTAAQWEPPPSPGGAAERDLVERLTRAFEAGDVAGIVALLTEDAWLTMPPLPMEYQGRDLAARFLTAVGRGRTWRLVPTRANGQPAFGFYVRDLHASVCHPLGLLVLTLSGSRICAMTRFDSSFLPRFGLTLTLPG